jgi:hypothetical protein
VFIKFTKEGIEMRKIICITLTFIISATSIIFASTITQNISVVPNQSKITMNGKSVTADNFLYKGTTYVPLRTISENLSCNVTWDQNSKTVNIVFPTSSTDSNLNDIYINDGLKDLHDQNLIRECVESMLLYTDLALTCYVNNSKSNDTFSSLDSTFLDATTKVNNLDNSLLLQRNRDLGYSTAFKQYLEDSKNNLNGYKNSKMTQSDAISAWKYEFAKKVVLKGKVLDGAVNPSIKNNIDSLLTLSESNIN